MVNGNRVKYYLQKAFGGDIAALIFGYYIDVMRRIWRCIFKKRLRIVHDELLGSVNQIHGSLNYHNFDMHWGLGIDDAEASRWCDPVSTASAYRICNVFGRGKWEITAVECLAGEKYTKNVSLVKDGESDYDPCQKKVYPYMPLRPGVASVYIGKDRYIFGKMCVLMEGREINVKVYSLSFDGKYGAVKFSLPDED